MSKGRDIVVAADNERLSQITATMIAKKSRPFDRITGTHLRGSCGRSDTHPGLPDSGR